MSQKKFILVQSKDIADKMITAGFRIVSESCGTYTFMNELPKNFNFESLDIKKICFTDKLCL